MVLDSEAQKTITALLNQEPSLDVWEKVVEQAERLADDRFIELLPWLEERLLGWSDYFRPARVAWVEHLLDGRSVPQFAMARLVSISGEYKGAYFIFDSKTSSLDSFRNYTRSTAVRNIAVLSLFDLNISDEGIDTLVTSPNTVGVRDLRMEQCRISDAGVALLVGSEWAQNLRLLSISREQNVTRRCAEIIASSPNLQSLEELNVDDVDEAGRELLLASKNLPRLKVLNRQED